jgi:hypothetical protein
MPPKKAKKVPTETKPMERRKTLLHASSLPDLTTSKQKNTDTLQTGAYPGVISLAYRDITNFEEGNSTYSCQAHCLH